MPTITDNALVIRRWDFSETSQTVSLFTRQHGIVRGLAKGAKRERGSFSGGLDVLTRGEAVAIVKPGRDLATITAWHLHERYRAVRERLDANRAAIYMVDLVHHLLIEHDPHPNLWDTLTQALAQLDQPLLIDWVLLRTQWALLVETGYQPEVFRDARSGSALPQDLDPLGFSASAGGAVVAPAPGGRGAWRVRRETVQMLQRIARDEPEPAGKTEAVRRANRLLAAYLREIIGTEPPAMRWAFSDLAQ